MKKISLVLTLFVTFATVKLSAQATTPEQGLQAEKNVTVNIKLNPIFSLTVSQAVVDLIFTNKGDYTSGKTVSIPDHLTVSSTGPFTVNVRSSAANFTKDNAETTLATSFLKLTASKSATEVVGTPSQVRNLSTANSALITSTHGGFDQKYNVDYRAEDGGTTKFIDLFKFSTGTEPTVYTTVLTYELVAN